MTARREIASKPFEFHGTVDEFARLPQFATGMTAHWSPEVGFMVVVGERTCGGRVVIQGYCKDVALALIGIVFEGLPIDDAFGVRIFSKPGPPALCAMCSWRHQPQGGYQALSTRPRC